MIRLNEEIILICDILFTVGEYSMYHPIPIQ